jgi:hypothetical protein
MASGAAPAASEANPQEFPEVQDTCMHVRFHALPIKAQAQPGAIRDAALRAAPQDDGIRARPHPEEPRKAWRLEG